MNPIQEAIQQALEEQFSPEFFYFRYKNKNYYFRNAKELILYVVYKLGSFDICIRIDSRTHFWEFPGRLAILHDIARISSLIEEKNFATIRCYSDRQNANDVTPDEIICILIDKFIYNQN